MAVLSVNEELLFSKTESFVDFHLWPLAADFNPRGWLRNFVPEEKDYALNLLNAFIYFAPPLLDALFIAAFQQLSHVFVAGADSFATMRNLWRTFCDSVLIVYVEGEAPNPTDSGYGYTRRARQLLGVRQSQVMTPQAALNRLLSGEIRPVVFVDDFVGSGSQFATTWYRPWLLDDGSERSFQQVAQSISTTFAYCPLVCTTYGQNTINLECPEVLLTPAHLLSEQYNLLSPECHLWPENLRGGAEAFVRSASERAGIVSGADSWRGFADLGLGLALGDSVPDATLPIFYWDKNGWIPLVRKR